MSSTPGHALTLGDLRGSAVLGQPLDVSVQVGTGDAEALTDDCLSAELLFGDFAQQAPSLRVQKPPPGAPSASLVRIRSSAAVNEPVVTVVLRATCGASTSRSYVLLSDFPSAGLPDTRALPVAQPAAVIPPGPSSAAPVAPDGPPRAVASSASVASAAKAVRPAVVVAKPKPAKASQATPAPAAKPPAALPAVSDTAPDSGRLVLKLDSEMVLLNPEELAALAAQRVSLPKMEPEGEVLKQSLQLDALQNDLKAFKELTSQNQAALAALEAKLGQAQANHIPVFWLYGLGALLLATLGALAWVLRQQQRAKQDWWQPVEADATEMLVSSTHAEPADTDTLATSVVAAPTPPLPTAPTPPAPSAAPSSAPVQPAAPLTPQAVATPVASSVDLDFDLDLLDGPTAPAPEALSTDMTKPSPLGIACDLHSEAIADIRQQAEFFVSLGQASRAINLLQRHIRESIEPHPRVFLDLLTLYHAQGMKAEFRELRQDFHRLFNAAAPDFPAFHQEGKSLLDYPEPLAELVQLWPSRETAAFLDACIFRTDLSAAQLGFDLAAFQDLLLLRTLVEDMPAGERSSMAEPQAQAQASLPGAGLALAPSAWMPPTTVPTTEEIELDFPFDLLNTQEKPKD